MTKEELQKEFNRQVENLIQKGYPEAAKLTQEAFIEEIESLRSKLEGLLLGELDLDKGYIPFVIVVSHMLVATDVAMSLVIKDGKEGVTKLFPLEPKDFSVIDAVEVPPYDFYLVIDIDRGKKTLNVHPQDAFIEIKNASRSPLTIDEGVAIITQFPEFLMRNNCFSLLASRHTGDKRVPAIWINGKNHPNLGWCWDGNPHTWLGSASCNMRIA